MKENLVLNTRCKKVLKFFHILFAGCVLGGLISILCILITKQNYNFGEDDFAVNLCIMKIFTWGVNYAFFALLATSLVYGLFTEWGFLKFRWIIFKWVLVLSMFIVTWFGLGPAINGMTSISDAGISNTVLSARYIAFQQKALLYIVIELISIILIFMISVLKPWGARSTILHIKQKVVVMILLPIIVICVGFSVANKVSLNKIRNMSIDNIDLNNVKDGTYQGEEKSGNYIYRVKVEVKDHKIINIVGIDNRKSPYVDYAEGIFTKIIKDQKVNVDAVTGATTTSKAFMKAVENALK